MLESTSASFFIVIPEVYLVVVALVFLFFSSFYSFKNNREQIVFFNKLYYSSVIAIALSLVLMYLIGFVSIGTFNNLFVSSANIYIFKIIIIILMIFITIVSRRYLIDRNIFIYEYIVVILFFLLGNLLLVSSNDFLSFYITLELVTITSYSLIFMSKDLESSNSAGLKYFLLGSLGTGFLLYGISLIYGFTGSTSFTEIASYLHNKPSNMIMSLGMVMLIVGIGFKLSLVPFHMWTPDVYTGINKFLILLFTVIAKSSIVFIFVRILWEPLISMQAEWSIILKILIVASATLGYIAAIYQNNFKTFIAYSSIANLSYVLLAALGVSDGNMLSIIFYLLTYGLALIGFTACLMILKKDGGSIVSIYDLKGLYKKYPYLAFALSAFLISMAGLPITAGFFGKIIIIYQALRNANYFLLSYVILLTVIMMYFYFKIIKIMYFSKEVNNFEVSYYSNRSLIDVSITLTLILSFIVGMILWILPLLYFIKGLVNIF